MAGFRVLAARSVDSADGRLNNPLENILSLIKVQADHPLDDDDDGQILTFCQFFFSFYRICLRERVFDIHSTDGRLNNSLRISLLLFITVPHQ